MIIFIFWSEIPHHVWKLLLNVTKCLPSKIWMNRTTVCKGIFEYQNCCILNLLKKQKNFHLSF
uniref:Uncharacterized protein n=1 Tax=Octopus bimaculoides TaxID=37653 RepID=A0A0L8HXR0_OCTBM